jgi:hypothetical protein
VAAGDAHRQAVVDSPNAERALGTPVEADVSNVPAASVDTEGKCCARDFDRLARLGDLPFVRGE